MINRPKVKLWEKFPEITRMVIDDHKKMNALGGCHDLAHAFMVAQYARIIADNDDLARLGWIAGLGHNSDRLFSDAEGKKRIEQYLEAAKLNREEKDWVRQAIRDHSKLNDPADNPVTIILKDADRLANIGPSVLMRVAQFFPGLPAVDPRYAINPEPNSRYNHTGSLLQNIRHFLEWEPWLRSAKAKKLSRPYFKKLRAYIKACGDQLTEVGLIPFPFPSDFDKKSGLK